MSTRKEVDLVDYQALVAVPRTDLTKISYDTLRYRHEIISELLTGYAAIADNQIPPYLFRNRSLPENYLNLIAFSRNSLSRTSHLAENAKLYDCLWLNPNLKVGGELVTRHEGCGSLKGLSMFIDRPDLIQLTGYYWHIGMATPSLQTISTCGYAASLVDHEADHLKALTGASRSPDDWRYSNKMVRYFKDINTEEESPIREVASWKTQKDKLWLVLSAITNQLEIIDSKGHFVRTFSPRLVL